MKHKPLVWYVDDLPENLEKLKQNRDQVLTIETFSSPEQILQALTTSRPDALLCDVFFYENV